MSPVAASVITGPVRLVNEPPTVDEPIVDPPVAAVTVAPVEELELDEEELLELEDDDEDDELSSTSVSVPKLVEPVTFAMVEVPVYTISPDARGVTRVGRTRTFCQVRLSFAPLFETDVTVKMI